MGSAIRSRYEPRAVVGAGAQGQVLCARDLVHDRLVALKIRQLHSTSERDEVLAEARTLLTLRPHPGVPLVREDFFSGGRYHIVMDWIEGVDLGRLLAEAGESGLPYQQILANLAQVAEALDHLHGHDPPIVHKDVKPSNIVVEASGRAVLVDFGISTGGRSRHGRSGTLGFLAPEIAAGETAGPASDIFSLAATAYFAFTGAHPEPGARPSWRGVPRPLVPRVEAALSRGLAIDPARRPSSARSLVELLAPPSVPNNLPIALTRFIGRHRELAQLVETMQRTRLLTLVGAGGVGKTRLAVELAGEVAWAYPDGVWVIELASVESDFVTATVAKALKVRETSGRSLTESLEDHLHGKHLLLVLDNCEHVLDAAAGLAESLLKHASRLQVLATSRQPLDVFGEFVHRVPTLSFPETHESRPIEEVATYEAVELFCERATAADHFFALSPDTAGQVTELCAALEGIPLALEMAASRLRKMSLAELTASLSDALALPGARTAPARQRTLAATVAWSYDLLRPDAAALFRRLGVFAGSFGLEAAERVCSGRGVDRSQVRELQQLLVDCSLLVLRSGLGAGNDRYRMLESVRLYASERAADEGELEWLVDRHLHWFLSTAADAEPHLFGPAEPAVLNRLEADNDNLRLALANAADRERGESFMRLAVALSRFWNVRGYWAEGRRWLEAAIVAFPEGPEALRAKALAAAALMSERQGDFSAAVALGERALQLARQAGQHTTAAEVLDSLSSAAQEQGDSERAESLLHECLAEWRVSGEVRGIVSSFAGALGEVGWKAVRLGQYGEARRLFEEALCVATQLGIARARSYAFLGLASVCETQGELADARRFLTEATSISEKLGDKRFLGLESYIRGLLAWDEGDVHDAEVGFREALRSARERGEQVLLIRALEGLARVAYAHCDANRAATLFAAAARLREAVPWPVAPADLPSYDAALASVREALDRASFEKACAYGANLSSEDAVRIALEHSSVASVHHRPLA